MRRYVQTPGPIGEFSELALRQRAEPLDLVYVGYGLLVVAVVLPAVPPCAAACTAIGTAIRSVSASEPSVRVSV